MKLTPLSELVGRLRTMQLGFMPTEGYDTLVAYILGFDVATGGGALTGLREWLITQVRDGTNLHWPDLVSMLLHQRAASNPETHEWGERERIDFLCDTLEEFFKVQQSRDGLSTIYFHYEAWLRRHKWYDPPTPYWLPPPAPKKPPHKRAKKAPTIRRKR
ncbi:hypothetical protein HUA76_13115 [Myxococcus sp. CA056]|uniref:hypothetical protein n=1 Tax=Myxococcus sp. CA056 TaxID=2741740 RepID=UPI00157B6197|nr:hypothetical protein [Myxococcus sp. CA056]NTX11734.1 hypothetical protein [Myxococcus sp. CA056]